MWGKGSITRAGTHFLALLVISAAPIQSHASELPYSFCLTVAGKTLRLSESEGTHWRYVEYRCGDSNSGCEFQVNQKGGRGSRPNETPDPFTAFDLGFTILGPNTAIVRCLQMTCILRIQPEEDFTRTVSLARQESVRVTLPARIRADCAAGVHATGKEQE